MNPLMPPAPSLDLNLPLPRRWPPETEPFAELLSVVRDEIRRDYGPAYAGNLITQRTLEALIKARGLDLLARQLIPADGPSFARAIVRLIIALTIPEPEEEE